jgi:hypothetical protein
VKVRYEDSFARLESMPNDCIGLHLAARHREINTNALCLLVSLERCNDFESGTAYLFVSKVKFRAEKVAYFEN